MSDLRASWMASLSLLRHLPLFVRAAPGTPLRVLAIMALDTVHTLRHARPIPKERIGQLASFLDFQACTNAAWDRKDLCHAEYETIERRLELAGLSSHMDGYLTALGNIESRRPPTGGDRRAFDEVRQYREGVVRISLAAVVAVAFDTASLEDAILEIDRDANLDALCLIALQCQVVDDLLDYARDLAGRLPSFLTATHSLSDSLALTADAARSYRTRPHSTAHVALPIRVALILVTAITTLVVRTAGSWHRHSQLPGMVQSQRI
jgi:hypothetical protein